VFGSEVLDVAIGIVLVYALLSVVCSSVHELLEAFLKNRAADLEKGVRELLGGDNSWVKALYEHPLVFGLFPGDYVAGHLANLPSYIPARNFALAVMDLVAPADAMGPGSGVGGATPPNANVTSFSPALPGLRQSLVTSTLPDKPRRALLTLVDAAGSDPAKSRENIEAWFNSAMDGVSARFKRRTYLAITLIGLVVAVLTNADSIRIVNQLTTDKAVRQSLVNASQEYAKASSSPAGVDATLQQIRTTGLPLGWVRSSTSADPRGFPEDPNGWLRKLLGLLLTVAATSMGAPFWFDLLNRFVVVRSTIKPHEKSGEESAKG
jgi:hypothetical protein